MFRTTICIGQVHARPQNQEKINEDEGIGPDTILKQLQRNGQPRGEQEMVLTRSFVGESVVLRTWWCVPGRRYPVQVRGVPLGPPDIRRCTKIVQIYKNTLSTCVPPLLYTYYVLRTTGYRSRY